MTSVSLRFVSDDRTSHGSGQRFGVTTALDQIILGALLNHLES
jgi:hypothetical protein